MSDDKDKKPPEDERTVIMPSGGDSPGEPADERSTLSDPEPPPIPSADEAPPAEPEPPEEPRTVFAPAGGGQAPPPAAESPFSAPPPAEPAPEPPRSKPKTTTITPREGARSIKVGDVLNHIFEVKRFIARGGMGEVFEGCNVNTEERVAIKVMLPAMAADEKIVALFRKEARILTKLQHEALVSYRVLAQEPQLGVLYIVTEYIEGIELSDMLDQVANSADEQIWLLRRLAAGLAQAHRLGAIHRDLSPDNVLLPGGNVHEATIIDFGIAKDLGAGASTIVGDGFAGKLNYVAPEQLGDYGREVGAWTDVYSLGLVMLAVTLGRPADMSGSLVDAIDKRRKGPDLSAVPRPLRSLLEDMLKPDPKERIRSMDEILDRLGDPDTTPPAEESTTPPAEPPEPGDTPTGSGRGPMLVAGLVALALLVAVGGLYALGYLDDLLGRGGGGGGGGGNEVGPGNEVEPRVDRTDTARSAITTVLPSVGCTWLDISRIEDGDGGLRVALRGVAGNAEAAERDIARALGNAGIRDARLDFGDVAPIRLPGCAALDTYRQMRADSATHVSVPQPRFERMMQPPGMPYAGEDAANAVINFDFTGLGSDFTLLGIEPSGAIATLIADRATFESARDQSQGGRPITDLGNGRFRLNVDVNHVGWSGIILISGRGPFDSGVVAPPIGSRGPDWQQQFVSAATDRDWQVEMVWFESVDRVQGDRAPPVAPPDPNKP